MIFGIAFIALAGLYYFTPKGLKIENLLVGGSRRRLVFSSILLLLIGLVSRTFLLYLAPYYLLANAINFLPPPFLDTIFAGGLATYLMMVSLLSFFFCFTIYPIVSSLNLSYRSRMKLNSSLVIIGTLGFITLLFLAATLATSSLGVTPPQQSSLIETLKKWIPVERIKEQFLFSSATLAPQDEALTGGTLGAYTAKIAQKLNRGNVTLPQNPIKTKPLSTRLLSNPKSLNIENAAPKLAPSPTPSSLLKLKRTGVTIEKLSPTISPKVDNVGKNFQNLAYHAANYSGPKKYVVKQKPSSWLEKFASAKEEILSDTKFSNKRGGWGIF